MITRDEVFSIKNKGVIDMAITFSAMNRVFEKGSKPRIAKKTEDSFSRLAMVESIEDFEVIHSEFCEWFVRNISKSRKVKESKAASYGQAAKLFNVALKVYVYYCNLPNIDTAAKLLPMLHAAVDTQMMKILIDRYPQGNFKAKTVEAVGKPDYIALKKLVNKHIEDKFENQIWPTQYDDVMWYQLNRLD